MSHDSTFKQVSSFKADDSSISWGQWGTTVWLFKKVTELQN